MAQIFREYSNEPMQGSLTLNHPREGVSPDVESEVVEDANKPSVLASIFFADFHDANFGRHDHDQYPGIGPGCYTCLNMMC